MHKVIRFPLLKQQQPLTFQMKFEFDLLQVLRVMYSWVAAHVVPPRDYNTLDVLAPLLPAADAAAEAALLGGLTGTWAERCAWLLLQLLRVYITNSYTITGFWKDGSLALGERLHCTNHTWVGVKVGGAPLQRCTTLLLVSPWFLAADCCLNAYNFKSRISLYCRGHSDLKCLCCAAGVQVNKGWRLVDVARTIVRRGFAPFFVPPEAFIYSYYPLKVSPRAL